MTCDLPLRGQGGRPASLSVLKVRLLLPPGQRLPSAVTVPFAHTLGGWGPALLSRGGGWLRAIYLSQDVVHTAQTHCRRTGMHTFHPGTVLGTSGDTNPHGEKPEKRVTLVWICPRN